MKSLIKKFVALTFIVALFAGCASSVTDSGLSQQPEQPATEQVTPDNPGFSTDSDMSPIVDKPE